MSDDARDENGLTETESGCWMLQYRALGDLFGAVLIAAPNEAEVRRRAQLLREDLAEVERRLLEQSAVD